MIEDQDSDGISLKDIIRYVREYSSEVWSKKWRIMCFSVVITTMYVAYNITRKPVYEGKLTFMVNDDEGGGMSGVGAILGEFGLGGGGGGGNHNYNKILEISTSHNLLSKVIYDSASISGTKDLIGNHIIDLYFLNDVWMESAELRDFRFVSTTETSELDSKRERRTNIATKNLVSLLRGNPKEPESKKLVSLNFDEESTILSLYTTTNNPELSVVIAEILYKELSKFYINKSIERQQSTYDALSFKADSLYDLLVGSEVSLANYIDRSKGVMLLKYKLPEARNQRKMEMYGAMYAEVLKNQQTAEFLLHSQTPYFQILDVPILPLNNSATLSKIVSVIVFIVLVVLGVLIAVGFAYFQNEIKPIFTEL